MSRNPLETLLKQLEENKSNFDSRPPQKLSRLIQRLSRQRFTTAEQLIQYHETLLFLRAYPPSEDVLRGVEDELKSFASRVKELIESGADISPLEHPELSGIAGMYVSDTFSYYIVRWLANRFESQIKFNWEWFEDQNRLAETWPRLMPLLEEDANVEANVPYQDWLNAARGKEREVSWLVRQFERLPKSEKEKAELYDSQKLYVTWTPSYSSTRTGMRLPVKNLYYHRESLIQRRDVSFVREVEKPAPPMTRLSPKEGQRILDLARETSTIRYRELYGFTHGDSKRVFQASLGRGVQLFVAGLPPVKRLPLRAYHAAMIFKNGIAVGYFEGLSLFEKMESGFNFYYTFREGETAWIYAQTLNVFRHLLNVTTFSIDPYQIGHENEEGIESGAFWFYRKLGFRPTRAEIRKLTEREEKKLTQNRSYRTPARRLRELAAGSMVLELNQNYRGDWDQFQLRTIGFEAQRCMAERYRGEADTFRSASLRYVEEELGLNLQKLNAVESTVWSDFAIVLSLRRDLKQWSREEKQALIEIVKAKAGSDEARYLKLMQKHKRLREEIIDLGSHSTL